MLLVLAISLTQSYSFDPFITTVASIVPLIGLIYLRPYRNDEGKLNAISAFVNLAFPLVASAIYLANSIINMSEFGWIISTIIVFVWLLMTEIIAVVRMVKIIPWKDIPLLQKCMKKGKKQVDGLLDKVKGEI
jgi:small neutral amino acid transporter SnatA (MarC family)